MDISTLQRLHRMGILSTGQARHFALGGLYSDGEPPLDLDKIITSGPKSPSLNSQLGRVVPDNLDNYPMEDLQNNPIDRLETRPSGLDQSALAGYFSRNSLPEGWVPPQDFMQTPWPTRNSWDPESIREFKKPEAVKFWQEQILRSNTDLTQEQRRLLTDNPLEYFRQEDVLKGKAYPSGAWSGTSEELQERNGLQVDPAPITLSGSQYSSFRQDNPSLSQSFNQSSSVAPVVTTPIVAAPPVASAVTAPTVSTIPPIASVAAPIVASPPIASAVAPPVVTAPVVNTVAPAISKAASITNPTVNKNTTNMITPNNSDRISFGHNDYNAYMADYNKNKGKYRDSQSIEDVYNIGNITKEERDRLQLLSPEELQKETYTPQEFNQYTAQDIPNNSGMFPYMSPLGTDFTSNMFQAGRAIRAPKGTPGRGLGIGLNLGAGLLEAARGIGSGMAYQNMNDQARNYYDDQMRKRLYTNAPQTQNANITGGVSEGKYGGLFQNNHFELGDSFTNPYFAEGGEQMMQEQMMQEQMAQQQMSQEDMPQEEQAMAQEQAAPQDKIQKIAEQLVAGLGSLEAIDAYLKEQQVDEATYNAIMQVAQQMIEGQNQSQPAMEEAPMEEAPTMRGGGKFKHRVGDKIEFTYKGKKHRGVIKKIENGQIYL